MFELDYMHLECLFSLVDKIQWWLQNALADGKAVTVTNMKDDVILQIND